MNNVHPMPSDKEMDELLVNNGLQRKNLLGYFVGENRLKIKYKACYIDRMKKQIKDRIFIITFIIIPEGLYNNLVNWKRLAIIDSTIIENEKL